MRISLLFGSLIIMSALILACSRVPIASNHVMSFQQKAKSAHHWDALADDIATQISNAVGVREITVKNRFNIAPPDNESPFNKAFNGFLINGLVNHGIMVTKDDTDTSVLSFDIQLIKHNSSRFTHKPGSFSLIAGGLWVMRDAIDQMPFAVPEFVFPALAMEAAMIADAGPQTHIELVVTSSIYENDRYVYRRSDIYYIETEDADLFREYMDLKVRSVEVTNK